MGSQDVHILSLILYPDSTTWNSSDQIPKIIDAYNETADICWIRHDKDKIEKENFLQEKKTHDHMFLRFHGNISKSKFQQDFEISGSNAFDINEFREKFELNPIISQEMKTKTWDECVRYCCHRTEKTKDKYQYPLEELHANFDYTKYFKELSSPDPWWLIVKRTVSWAKKRQANVEEVFDYIIRNNYQDQYKTCSRFIDKQLDRYTWYSSTLPSFKYDQEKDGVKINE